MIERFFFGNRALLDQYLDMTVVAGPIQYPALSHLVDATVPDVRPVGTAFLHQADGAGCTWPKIDGNICTEPHDLVMCARQCGVQETLRIEDWQLRGHEHVLHDLEPGLGGAGAVRVPAHAVEHEHQRRVVGDDDSSTILVILAVAEGRDFRVFDLHSELSLECPVAET